MLCAGFVPRVIEELWVFVFAQMVVANVVFLELGVLHEI